MTSYVHHGGNRAQAVFRTVAGQPSWITRIALMTFLIIISIPILLLLLLAVLAAIIIFSVLALANAAVIAIRALLGPRSSGRENVRVIRRI